jgi:putative ABC transport system permease protein
LLQDLRLAVRSLRATPVVTGVAILSLALGIGANTAIFSLVDHLVLRSLPVREPARLVLVTTTAPLSYKPNYSYALFDALAAHTELFDGVLAVANCCGQSTLTVDDAHEFVDRMFVSGSYFGTLGVNALLGRVLTPADDQLAGGPDGTAVVLSYRAWKRHFNSDARVVGSQVLLDRVPVTIVGVLPPFFVGTEVGRTVDVFLPIRGASAVLSRAPFDQYSSGALNVIVRLKPGQTVASAAAAVRALQPELRSRTRPPNEPLTEYLKEPLTLAPANGGTSGGSPSLRERFARPLAAVFAVVLMVLLIAAANVANMQLARGMARRHELSVRLALGSSRWQLARLLIAESVLLAAAGTAIGVVFAKWAGTLLVAQLSTNNRPITFDGAIDWRVLAFAAAVMIVTTIVFGVAPAIHASRVAPIDALKDRGQNAHAGGARLSDLVVIAQVAVSLALVVAAGLFARTFTHLIKVPLGLDRTDTLLLTIRTPTVPESERNALFHRLVKVVAAVPGVDVAGGSINAPLAGTLVGDFVVSEPGASPPASAERLRQSDWVTPGMFAAFGIALDSGRDFDERDTPATPKVMIVNEAFVRRFSPGASPIGKPLTLTFRAQGDYVLGTLTVVGIVRDSVFRSIRAPDEPTVYLPLGQDTSPILTNNFYFGVRSTKQTPERLTHAVSAAILEVNRDIVLKARPLADEVRDAMAQDRIVAELSGFFGGLAMLLAGLGLYGVTSYAVTRRRAELGIRMALGAAPTMVIRLVLTRVSALVGAGVAVGLMFALAAARFVTTLLFGLESHDPATLVGAAITLVAVGTAAGWLPAYRASRIDPAEVLRET